jgi:phage terminase small subunit
MPSPPRKAAPKALQSLASSGALPLENPRWEAFAQQVASGASQTAAYRTAGFATQSQVTAAKQGSKLVKRPEVAARLAFLRSQLAAASHVDRDRIASELSAVGFGRITDVVEWEQGRLVIKDSAALTDAQRAAISRVVLTRNKDGSERLAIDHHDKLTALRDLARLLDLLPKDEAGPVGPTVILVAPEKLGADAWMRKYAPADVTQGLPALPPGSAASEEDE